MQLTEHFSLAELTFSEVAARKGWDNTPTAEVREHLILLAHTLEEIRARLGFPLFVTSGYRSWPLNAEIGGSRTSYHPLGLAADFVCPEYGRPLAVCRAIAAMDLALDQVIHEFGRWVHVGIPRPGAPARRQLLTARRDHLTTVYEPGLREIA